jgi:NaMN:DMB phosphoribosyltransferase
MAMDTNTQPMTIEDVRTAAEVEFDQANPMPEPPVPPKIARPMVVNLANTHAWIELKSTQSYRTTAEVFPHLYIIKENGNETIRVDGKLDEDEIDALIEELQAVKANLAAKRAYHEAAAKHAEEEKNWNARRTEFIRVHTVAWQSEQLKAMVPSK